MPLASKTVRLTIESLQTCVTMAAYGCAAPRLLMLSMWVAKPASALFGSG